MPGLEFRRLEDRAVAPKEQNLSSYRYPGCRRLRRSDLSWLRPTQIYMHILFAMQDRQAHYRRESPNEEYIEPLSRFTVPRDQRYIFPPMEPDGRRSYGAAPLSGGWRSYKDFAPTEHVSVLENVQTSEPSTSH